MPTRKVVTKKNIIARYVFAFVLVVAGIVANYMNLADEFLGFQSVGNWLIFVGFIMFAVVTISAISKKDRIVDERMEKIAYMSSRVTFIFIILGAFVVMVWDGISKINVPYSIFMSNMMAWIVLVYFVSYKIIEKYYY